MFSNAIQVRKISASDFKGYLKKTGSNSQNGRIVFAMPKDLTGL